MAQSVTQKITSSSKKMKHILKTTLILAAIVLAGCSDDKKPYDFFARGGITIGAPAALGSGSYKIPLEFETEIAHSGQWIDAVDVDVAGADILLTATFTSANRKSSYPGYIKVNGVLPGTYNLKYRDPNGTVHAIGPVILPR
jgi:hypothetical protein